MQLVGHVAAMQVLELPEKRCDADAAGDQYVLARNLVEAEQIYRMGNFQSAADLDHIVHEMRSAAAFFHAPDADFVSVQMQWRAEQRIRIAMHAPRVLHHHDDVRAAGKYRQTAAADRRELEVLDERRHLLDADDLDGDGLCIVHRNTSFSGGNSPGASASAMTPIYAARRR